MPGTTESKVSFGLKNVHYAPYTVENGKVTFGTILPIPGAVEMTNDPVGDPIKFYADNMIYYSADNNQGYEGKLSVAKIPDAFATGILGQELDPDDGTLSEYSDAKTKPFALLFEFENDIKSRRHVMYNCNAQRTSISSASKKDSVDPNVVELSYTSTPIMMDGRPIVKTSTTENTPAATYDNWYSNVFTKGVSVSISPSTASLAAGATQQLTATVNKATDQSVTWTSSDTAVATVDSSGLVTADSGATSGTTVTITATSVEDTNATATCVVTIS